MIQENSLRQSLKVENSSLSLRMGNINSKCVVWASNLKKKPLCLWEQWILCLMYCSSGML